jgi:hypothetical protein
VTDERNTHDDDGPWRKLEKQLAEVDECPPREEFESDLRRQFVTGFEEREAATPARAQKRSTGGARVQLWTVVGMAAAVLVAVGWSARWCDARSP